MEFGSADVKDVGEHTGSALIDMSNTFAIQGDIFSRTEPFGRIEFCSERG